MDSRGGMVVTGENRRTLRKNCSSATFSTTNPTGLAPLRARASAMKGPPEP
jgi:hypothetical protein